MSDSFYRAFEERYRGSRDVIKTRLRAYHSFLDPLASLYPGAEALDIGCGRGEWLELLLEHGFSAHGVDLDDGMLAACRERGLRAEHADALLTLQAQKDDSLALVSAFHVVEHLPFDVVRAIVREALRALKPGGLLIFETPNPENLVVGASDFYLDPSHERPIPPNLLAFVTEHAGFVRNKIVRLQEPEGLRDMKDVLLLNVLSGVSPDYSVVAQKPANAEILAQFDGAFDASYGLMLDVLALRYDEQVAARLDNVHRRIAKSADLEARHHADLMNRSAQIEHRLGQLEARIIDAEARAREYDAKATQYADQLLATLQSRSWRVTAPLRFAGSHARRLRSAIRERRIASGIKRRVKALVRRTVFGVQRQPALASLSIAVLNRFPSLKYRLRSLTQEPVASRPFMATDETHMSHRTAYVYRQLRKAVKNAGKGQR